MVLKKFYHSLKKYLLGKVKTRYNQIYILPTKMGFYFLSIVFILFIISISYGNPLAYSSSFIFVSVVIVSAINTHYNLKNIKVFSFNNNQAFFENNESVLEISIFHENKNKKYDLSVICKDAIAVGVNELKKNDKKEIKIKMNNLKRGKYFFKKITFTTSFPFGLFYSWTHKDTKGEFFVYPKVIDSASLPPFTSMEGEGGSSKDLGFSDFEEHKKHFHGMPFNHVDWKLYAKGKGLYLKSFKVDHSKYYLFSLDMLKALTLEDALSQLGSWLVLANEKRFNWILSLPEGRTDLSSGGLHLDKCLKMLACCERREKEIVF